MTFVHISFLNFLNARLENSKNNTTNDKILPKIRARGTSSFLNLVTSHALTNLSNLSTILIGNGIEWPKLLVKCRIIISI